LEEAAKANRSDADPGPEGLIGPAEEGLEEIPLPKQ
jgi:hypothetical protein